MILAADTSSVICSVGLADGDRILWEKNDRGAQIHIEKLSPFLQEGLKVCEEHGSTLEALAIAIGPGSFNGLRIGLATLKALAVSLELPLIPIPTTDALVQGVRGELKGLCRAVIYSHRNFVHFADYDLEDPEQPVTPELSYAPWDELYEEHIDHYLGRADRGFETWLKSPAGLTVGSRFVSRDAQAAQVAILAGSRLDKGIRQLDELEPLYNAVYEARKWVPPQF